MKYVLGLVFMLLGTWEKIKNIGLDYPDRESIPDNLSQEWRSARRWFVEHAHLREGEFEMQAPDEVERHFQNLDNFLYAAAASELEQLRSLHEILEETNE